MTWAECLGVRSDLVPHHMAALYRYEGEDERDVLVWDWDKLIWKRSLLSGLFETNVQRGPIANRQWELKEAFRRFPDGPGYLLLAWDLNPWVLGLLWTNLPLGDVGKPGWPVASKSVPEGFHLDVEKFIFPLDYPTVWERLLAAV